MFITNPLFVMFGMVLCLSLLLVRRPQVLATCPGIAGAAVFATGIYVTMNWGQITASGQQFITAYLR